MSHSCIANIVDSVGVADLLGVSIERVRQLDHVLKPARFGRTRIYDRAAVSRYAAARDARRVWGAQ